jgi:hypothetical protein
VDDTTAPGFTAVPMWTLAAIMFGLVALTGSVVAICLAVIPVVLVWLAKAPPVAHDRPYPGLFGEPERPDGR